MTVHMDADALRDSASENLCAAWDESAERLRQLAGQCFNDIEIAQIMGRSQHAISHARIRFKIPAGRKTAKRLGPPADFEQVAPTLTMEEARVRYRTGREVLREWYARFGLKPRVRVYANGSTVGNLIRKPKVPRKRFVVAQLYPTPTPQRDFSLIGRAVSHLQRSGPVFRATTIDPRASKDAWIINGRRVDETELLAMAERKGFRPETGAP